MREVDFDLNEIYQSFRLDRNNSSINEINNNVLKAMVSGCHSESFAEAYRRVIGLFKLLDKNKKGTKCLVVTHDFIMRVIEIHIKNNGQINLSKIYNELKNTKRNLYLQGFHN